MIGNELLEVPDSWQEVALNQLASLIRGVSYKKENAKKSPADGLIPILRATNIGSELTFEDLVYVPSHYVSDDQMLQPGDVVIAASSGSKEIVGKSAQLLNGTWTGSFGAFCNVVRPDSNLSLKYLGYYFQTHKYRRAVSDLSSGSNINNLKSSDLSAHLIPVAPFNEQTRIVGKLEELLSELDAGMVELKAAHKKLAQYRQSLLKSAVEGSLTAEWRKNNKVQETGAQLLARILTERRTRWEEKQLAKFKEQGKTLSKGWQNKYPEPVKPDVSNMPELPDGWVWANVDQLSMFITSGSRGWAEYYSQSGAVFIRSQDINTDALVLDSVAHVKPPKSSEGVRTKVQKHDLLVTITGANVAKCAAVEFELEEAYVSQHVALIRPVNKYLSGYLHKFFTCGVSGRKQLLDFAYGAGKPGLNLEQVASVVVPLPPENEVVQIVDVITSAFTDLDATQETITLSLNQSAAQRKNILKTAFSGQLVPQDPNDEPASVLLERIRAERAAQSANGKPRQRKSKPLSKDTK